MMDYQVFVVSEAEEDLFDIHQYIALNDTQQKAWHVTDHLKETCVSLAHAPERGHFPPELERIGISDYREIHFKPYRVIYQILGKQVFIHAVLDGRRNLQELLERRLLR